MVGLRRRRSYLRDCLEDLELGERTELNASDADKVDLVVALDASDDTSVGRQFGRRRLTGAVLELR